MKHVKATASQFASSLLSIKGRPLDFAEYKPFELIYNIDPDTLVMKAGRQIGKSVSLAGRTVTKSVLRKYFNSLYVAPFQIQAKRFSSAYLDAFIASPIIKRHFKRRDTVNNVFEKGFTTGSTSYLSYAQTEHDADRIRGISADQVTFDEVQDISKDAIAPIIEVMGASKHKLKIFAGTSKSTANTLERLWLTSNQMEWAIKCPCCSKWVIPNTVSRCLAICSKPEGPSCYHCGGRIDVTKGQWVAAVPAIRDVYGFHLPQFIMAANTGPKTWMDIYRKVKNSENGVLYSPGKLANEVFGLATDLAGKSLSPREARKCCNEQWTSWCRDRAEAARKFGVIRVAMGIDWSVTGSEKSFTAISVVGMDALGKVYLLYAEILQGTHILSQVEHARQIFNRFECDICGSDRGVGVLQAELLQDSLGFQKVVMVQYVSASLRLRWDSKGLFLAADRTRCMDIAMQKMRRGQAKFETPSWERTAHLWEHALAIYEEETLVGKRVYRHPDDEPDDWFHSICFALIGVEYMTGNYAFVE